MDGPITDFEKGQLDSVLKMGCSRDTACKYAGVSADRLLAEMQRDPTFERSILHAESHPEVRHIGNVNKASQDERNWRSSVWWLERREREQESAHDWSQWNYPAAVRDALDKLIDVVMTEIVDPVRRQAIVAELLKIAGEGVSESGDSAHTETVAPSLTLPVVDAEEEDQ
ncbi:MAG: hypothetical protein H0T51_18835 [Pirellulales bacterium]|nr:hypothetical protein [Pirellulales bacterium]